MWNELKEEIKKPYFEAMMDRIEQERNTYTVYPKSQDVFQAFERTPLESVRVVILGQDPYHQPNQAMGLSFSVEHDVLPKSLINIYKELESDLGIKRTTGDLRAWADQGVFLYNTVLTVRESEPRSHRDYGWLQFTDAVIDCLSSRSKPIIFVLWGKDAEAYKARIASHHICLVAPHPSPLAAYRGFFGSKPFSTINSYLDEPIDWSAL